MLILTRRASETLMIGDNIQVTVLGVKGNHVRVSIEAPKAIPVIREELLTRDRNQTPIPDYSGPIFTGGLVGE